MDFDISLIISCAALAFSVLSPVVSSIITGCFRLKEKRLDIQAEKQKHQQQFYEEHRAIVIERYLNAVGMACKMPNGQNIHQFGESMGEIYLYIDESLWGLLDNISDKISRFQVEPPIDDLKALCRALSHEGIRTKNEE